MNALVLAQIAVPAALILWMAFALPHRTSGICIQFAVSAV